VATNLRTSVQPYFLSLRSTNIAQPDLHSVSRFLFDLTLLYEISRLATDPRYLFTPLPRMVRYRRLSHLRHEDRLRVERLRLESPLALTATLPALGGASTALMTMWAGIAAFLSLIPEPMLYGGGAVVALKALAKGGKDIAEAVKILAEAGKHVAEGRKSLAEGERIRAEAQKLLAETAKLNVEVEASQLDITERRTSSLMVPTEMQPALSEEERQGITIQSKSLERRAAVKLVHGLDSGELSQSLNETDMQELLESVVTLLASRDATETYGQALQRLTSSPILIAEMRISIMPVDSQPE
jgi:hypothetical protein